MADARKPTQRYLSGRVKIVNNAGLHTDRHLYVSPGEVEPNLGYPGEKSVPLSNTYFQLITIPNGDTYDRYWQQQPGLQPGGISVFDESTLIGVANSISKLNFVGAGVTATASGTISTITIDASSARVRSLVIHQHLQHHKMVIYGGIRILVNFMFTMWMLTVLNG